MGWLICDLHRPGFSYWGFPLLARLLMVHRIVREDGRLSIARSFRQADWEVYLREADIPPDAGAHRPPLRLAPVRRTPRIGLRPTMTNSPPSPPRLFIQPICASTDFERPFVFGGREQVFGLVADQRARIGRHIVDAVGGEPAADFGDAMAVLLRVAILVAQPGLAPLGLGGAVAQHRVERDPAIAGQPGDHAAQPQGQRARSDCRGRSRRGRRASPPPTMCANEARGIGRVVEHARGIDEVERAMPSAADRARSHSTKLTLSTP